MLKLRLQNPVTFQAIFFTGTGRFHQISLLRGLDSNQEPIDYIYPAVASGDGLYHLPPKLVGERGASSYAHTCRTTSFPPLLKLREDTIGIVSTPSRRHC